MLPGNDSLYIRIDVSPRIGAEVGRWWEARKRPTGERVRRPGDVFGLEADESSQQERPCLTRCSRAARSCLRRREFHLAPVPGITASHRQNLVIGRVQVHLLVDRVDQSRSVPGQKGKNRVEPLLQLPVRVEQV